MYLGTASCQLSKAKCMTASVYPHSTQLLLLAVKPSNTDIPISLLACPSSCDSPPRPRSRWRSLLTAAISFFIHSETSWNSSWASWCSREEKRELCFPGEWFTKASMISSGRIERYELRGVFNSETCFQRKYILQKHHTDPAAMREGRR